jgi:pimeloyl-ACP methyl ester carboxylesterase
MGWPFVHSLHLGHNSPVARSCRSFGPTGGFAYDVVAKCLIGILDEIAVKTAVLVGLSLGGHINQYVTHHYPEHLTTLVDIGSTDLHLGFSRWLVPFFKQQV